MHKNCLGTLDADSIMTKLRIKTAFASEFEEMVIETINAVIKGWVAFKEECLSSNAD